MADTVEKVAGWLMQRRCRDSLLLAGSTGRALAGAAALPQSACPCSKARAWVRLGLHFRDLAWSNSSVTEDEHHARSLEGLESHQLSNNLRHRMPADADRVDRD
jgi:hypothetical protein